MELRRHLLLGLGGYVLELRSILRWKTLLGDGDKLERLAVENGNRSGGRESGRPRRPSLKTRFSGEMTAAPLLKRGNFKSNMLQAELSRAWPRPVSGKLRSSRFFQIFSGDR